MQVPRHNNIIINVQNISLHLCYRQHLRTCTSKTAKITKGDIARITLTVCQCAAE